eukprot:2153966-Pyramimonas_sp.AAC.1
MVQVWAEIQSHGGCSYSSITLKIFMNEKKPWDEFPKLKGRGSQAKSLVAPLLRVWAWHRSDGVLYDTVLNLLETLLEISDLVDSTAMEIFMPLADCAVLETSMNKFLGGAKITLGLSLDVEEPLAPPP